MSAKEYDLSRGNALRPFTELAQIAFAEAAQTANLYIDDPLALGRKAATPLEAAQESMREFVHALGWQRSDGNAYGDNSFAMIEGGTTRAFHLLLKSIADIVKSERVFRATDIEPVIIMPTPTYGYFTDAPKRYGIAVKTIARDLRANGALDIESLKDLIDECHQEGKMVVGYYDCTPHNPLGIIRTAEETRDVGHVFAALRERYHGIGIYQPASHSNHTPKSRFAAFPLLIDDQVYRGLQYDGHADIPSFAQETDRFDRSLYDQTVTLFGPSKAGLAGMRAGVAAGVYKIVDQMRSLQFNESYFQSPAMLSAVTHFYNPQGPHAQAVSSHMTRLNYDNRIRGHLMKALFNGMDTMDELSSEDKDTLLSITAEHLKDETINPAAILEGGINGMQIITTPEAGFFHVLENTDQMMDEDGNFLLERIRGKHNISYVPLAWTGYEHPETSEYPDPSPYMSRVTFALPFEDIFAVAAAFRDEVEASVNAAQIGAPACV